MTTEGRKDDKAKVRIELIAPELLFAIGDISTFGALKYGDRNWELGMNWSRVFGALMRHMWAWWGGGLPTRENFLLGTLGHTDAETGKSHLWHAGCCLMYLIAYEARGTGTDDRPTSTVPTKKPPQPPARYSDGSTHEDKFVKGR